QPARPAPRTQPTAPARAPARTNPLASAPAAAPKTEEDCACDAGPLPSVLAVVNGIKITNTDLSAETEAQVREYERQMAIARKGELDHEINAKLLEAEAKRRGITTDKLYEAEIVSQVAPPTDAEVQATFEQNKAQIE